MKSETRSRGTVSSRAAAGLVLAATLLGAAVGTASVGERRSLPVAASQLSKAIIAEADALACLQGVQDDLFIDTKGDFDAASVAAARSRLVGCPVTAAVKASEAVSVPTAPPLESSAWRKLRDAVATGASATHRGVLDVVAAASATTSDLADHRHGTQLILAYRAAYADYVAASRQETLVEALLARADIGPARSSL